MKKKHVSQATPQPIYVVDSAGSIRPLHDRYTSMIDLQQGGRVFYRANSVPGGLEEEEGMKDDSVQKAASASEETLPDVPPPSRAASLAPIDQSALAAAGIGARPRK